MSEELQTLEYGTIERARDYVYQDWLAEMYNTTAEEDIEASSTYIMQQCLNYSVEELDLAITNLDMHWDDFK